MGSIRIFVPTFRRAHLLPRALQSLQAQTFPHWTAEVHNDDPADPGPARIVAALGDPRIRCINHERTLGGVKVFNLVFREQPEPFVSLLEDDNWWMPDFLERMLAALNARPDVSLAWSNQRIWEEMADGTWQDTGRHVRPPTAGCAPVPFTFPHPAQCFGALHANGSMLLRVRPGQAFPTPVMQFGGTEAVRERSLPHPLLYVPGALGVFAVTRATHRSSNPVVWATTQVLLAASFLRHAPLAAAQWDQLWHDARMAPQRMTATLLLATRQDPALRPHRIRATPADWRDLALHAARHPRRFLQLLRARPRCPGLWEFLDRHTAARAREAVSAPSVPSLPF
jgi:hypothetical protein